MDSALFDLNSEIETSHWWFVARRAIMRAVLESVVPPGQAHKIVEVGCGTGANIAALVDDYECVGIDPSEAAIEHARKRFPQVSYLEGAAPADLGEGRGRVDAYLVMDVLEHTKDDRGLVTELVESLDPGGYFLITVPADMRLWTEHDVTHGHFRRYDRDSLRALWYDLPVSEHLVSYFNSRLYPAVRLMRAVSKKRGRAMGREGSDLKVPSKPVNALLRSMFAGEAKRLVRSVGRPPKRGYRRGVSMIALLRREPGS